MLGAYGYAGGMKKLLDDSAVPDDSLKKRALKHFNVWHVGGPNRFKQYRPQHFCVPVIERAVRGGASRLVCLVTEGTQGGKSMKADSGLVGDIDDIKRYLQTSMGTNLRVGYYYRLLNPVHEVQNNTSVSPCKLYIEFDLSVYENWEKAWGHVWSVIRVIRSRLEYEAEVADLTADLVHIAHNSNTHHTTSTGLTYHTGACGCLL
jgi:hypothetical protein